MFRILKVMLASFAVAALGVAGLDAHVARADWSETGLDWDESAPVVSTLDLDDASALADHFFHVEWTAGQGAAGRARITGYVYNDYGDSAVNVALRVHEIDASGNDVARVVTPIGGAVPAHGRTYFDVAVPQSR
ncbi:MAG TPA: hypothetical protein VKA83_09550, partial [Methylomirabilota bacterium]|nr:hypothetical protein [Methylomirabilota bacterium]